MTPLLPGTRAMIAMPRRHFLLSLVASLLPGIAAARPAGAPDMFALAMDYTATSQSRTGQGSVPGRLWRSARALRHESDAPGRAHLLIARLDRNLGWLALPGLGVALETDLSALGLPPDAASGGGLVQTIEGRARVNGLDTTRIRVRHAAGTAAQFDGHVWRTESGVIARIDGEGELHGRRGRARIDFRDPRIGFLDEGVFAPPRDLRLLRVRGADAAALLQSLEAMRRLGRGAP